MWTYSNHSARQETASLTTEAYLGLVVSINLLSPRLTKQLLVGNWCHVGGANVTCRRSVQAAAYRHRRATHNTQCCLSHPCASIRNLRLARWHQYAAVRRVPGGPWAVTSSTAESFTKAESAAGNPYDLVSTIKEQIPRSYYYPDKFLPKCSDGLQVCPTGYMNLVCKAYWLC